MTHEEHHDIIEILTKESWQARTKMLEYMKTVKVEENIPIVEEAPKDPVELNFGPLRGIKPDYPEYTEAPTL